MKGFILFAFASVLLSSCLNLPGLEDNTPINDNAELYNTEWSNKDKSEGLKFYNDDTVLSFAGGSRSKGTFDYTVFSSVTETGAIGFMTFEGLENYFSTYTTVIDAASILEDGTMKLYWHIMGEEKGYYQILYQRR